MSTPITSHKNKKYISRKIRALDGSEVSDPEQEYPPGVSYRQPFCYHCYQWVTTKGNRLRASRMRERYQTDEKHRRTRIDYIKKKQREKRARTHPHNNLLSDEKDPFIPPSQPDTPTASSDEEEDEKQPRKKKLDISLLKRKRRKTMITVVDPHLTSRETPRAVLVQPLLDSQTR